MSQEFNVETKIEGNKLIIEVDLTKDRGLSSSGKNILIATTSGSKPVPDKPEVQYGLNVYRKPEKK